MSEFKGTPGPWVAVPFRNTPGFFGIRTKTASLADSKWIADIGGPPASEENARLIAAAPELLALAERLANSDGAREGCACQVCGIGCDARALVARIKGE